MPADAATRTLEVELPSEAFRAVPRDPPTLARELRVLFLVDLVRQRRLAYGKAAELAGMPISSFLREMGRHGVSAFDYDDDELSREVE